jgi:hypothetical protein
MSSAKSKSTSIAQIFQYSFRSMPRLGTIVRSGACSFATVFLVSCATTGNFEQILQSWIGVDVDQLVSTWGPPQSSYPLRGGGQVFEYANQRVAQVGGFVSTTPQTTYENGNATLYSSGVSARGTYSGTSTTYVQRQTPVYNVQLTCSTRFTISPQGIVSSWAWQGNNCRALPLNVPSRTETAATSNGPSSEEFVPDAQRGIVAGSKVQLSLEPMSLYKDASRDSLRLSRLYMVDVLIVNELAEDWLRVQAPDGTQGWIMRIWVGSTSNSAY